MYKVINVEPAQCRDGVRPCLPIGKVWRGGDGSFTGFDFGVMDDEIRVVNEKLDTSCWPAYICNRIMTLLTGWMVGENEETYIDGLDANDI